MSNPGVSIRYPSTGRPMATQAGSAYFPKSRPRERRPQEGVRVPPPSQERRPPTIHYSSEQPHSDISQMANREPYSRPRSSTDPDRIQDTYIPPPAPNNYSAASVENVRYHLHEASSSDHTNEDRHFSLVQVDFQVFAVFDGHDGQRAAGFASFNLVELFQSKSWQSVVSKKDPGMVNHALSEFFKTTDRDFFNSIQCYLEDRRILQAVIPPGMKSYQAYQLYPTEVMRLQELEGKVSGGSTAAVAVVCLNKIFVANVGDSRVVLVREGHNGTLNAEQLSVDHTTENEDELKRLEKLGLVPRELIRAGRLGTQENTRSFGDYSIKDGYRDVDVLSHARSPPGTAEPFLLPPLDIDESFRYLIVMSDGVYKSIEDTFFNTQSIDPNKVLLGVIDTESKHNNMEALSDAVLRRIGRIHEDTYQREAETDPRSPVAGACRKRDDMTLLIYKFPLESSV